MYPLVIFLALCLATGTATAQDAGSDTGSAPVVGMIVFQGNHRTKTKVLAREMLLKEGDLFDEVLFQASLQRIRNLGLFYKVAGDVAPIAGTNRRRLTVQVKEKWTILPLPQIDISDEGNVKLGISYADYNFRGEDQRLTIKAKHSFGTGDTSERGDSAAIDLTMPEFRDTPYDIDVGVGWAADGSASTRSDLTIEDDSDATSIDVDLGIHHFRREGTNRRRMGVGFTVNYVEQTGDTGKRQSQWINSVKFGHSLDSVDDFTYTFEGHRWNYSVQLFTAILGSTVNAVQLDMGYQWYWKFGEHNLTARAQTGYTVGPDAAEVAFDIGGGSSLRGIDKDSLEGAGMWLGNLEYRSPRAWTWLGGAVFVDAGTAGEPYDLVDPNRVAAGGGVGLRVYVARLVGVVLRLDVAYGYHPDEGANPKVYFSLKQPL
jgi:outer membrane protein assembly factor BamA